MPGGVARPVPTVVSLAGPCNLSLALEPRRSEAGAFPVQGSRFRVEDERIESKDHPCYNATAAGAGTTTAATATTTTMKTTTTATATTTTRTTTTTATTTRN